MTYDFKTNGLVKYAIKKGGSIKPLIVDSSLTGGTGLMNPSVFVDEDKSIYCIIRNTNYILNHSEHSIYHQKYGPLQYLHPEGDQTLRTINYIAKLNSNLDIEYCHKINTSKFDKKPIWEFHGNEDARLFKWNKKYYMCGVRRDDNTTGIGRMELSEIEFDKESAHEVKRYKIPAPNEKDNPYCEKNWMPVLDKPYHWIKWTDPTELVNYNKKTKKTKVVKLSEHVFSTENNFNFRGGGQVLQLDDGSWLALTHETELWNDQLQRKNGHYQHRFLLWDKEWNLIRTGQTFNFLTGLIEFAVGIALYDSNLLISFGFQDNAAYILSMPVTCLNELFKRDAL